MAKRLAVTEPNDLFDSELGKENPRNLHPDTAKASTTFWSLAYHIGRIAEGQVSATTGQPSLQRSLEALLNGNAQEKAHLLKIRSRAFQLFKDFDATQDPHIVWYMRTLKAYVTLVERGHDGNRYSLVGSDAALATKNIAIDVLIYIFEGKCWLYKYKISC